jgi:hypothetical protein
VQPAANSRVNISQLGGNTYQVNAIGQFPMGAKVAALDAAKRTCIDAQREVLVNTIEPGPQPWYSAAVTFQCRQHGNPALMNPTYTKPPSVVIEDQR